MKFALGCSLVLAALFMGVAPANATTIRNINISGFAFSPQFDTVIVHDSVVWTNHDAATHEPKSGSLNGNFTDPWTSAALGSGGVFSRKFDKLGIINYVCAFHGSMTGKVVVITSFAAAPETWSRLKRQYRSKPAGRSEAGKSGALGARSTNGVASQRR